MWLRFASDRILCAATSIGETITFEIVRASWRREGYWIPPETCNSVRLHNHYSTQDSAYLRKLSVFWGFAGTLIVFLPHHLLYHPPVPLRACGLLCSCDSSELNWPQQMSSRATLAQPSQWALAPIWHPHLPPAHTLTPWGGRAYRWLPVQRILPDEPKHFNILARRTIGSALLRHQQARWLPQ